jgi:hypothetical protein
MFDLDYNGCELYFVISEERRSSIEAKKKFLHALTFGLLMMVGNGSANSNPVARMVYIVGHEFCENYRCRQCGIKNYELSSARNELQQAIFLTISLFPYYSIG